MSLPSKLPRVFIVNLLGTLKPVNSIIEQCNSAVKMGSLCVQISEVSYECKWEASGSGKLYK